ncbi:MAG: PLP-dependent aminotransferase family protein [Hyphomicrobium sp.]
MAAWIPRLNHAGNLKYLSIIEALESDIRSGALKPGERLPPHRAIADALGVDVTTVTRAFNEAKSRGLVQATAGRGTFVSAEWRDANMAALENAVSVDLSMNSPPQPEAANVVALFAEATAQVLSGRHGAFRLHYQETTGSAYDRAAASEWLARRIADITTARVLLSSGAQCALYAILTMLLSHGDLIAAGAFTYPGLKAIAARRGFRLAALDMDSDGILPESFERLCLREPPKALYVIPTMDNPTTATLSVARRRLLADIARRFGVAIVEDDPYAPLSAEPHEPIASFAPDITWHIATLSKCATPAMRIAYVVAPDGAGALHLQSVLRATNLMPPPVNAAVCSNWIGMGVLDRITLAIRRENNARHALARSALRDQRLAADHDGHHIWLHLPDYWRADTFAGHAARSGISVVPASAFAISNSSVQAVRLSLGVAPSRAVLTDALRTLSALISEQPDMRVVV